MAKDPAFLFYPNDYMGGTMGMTFEEKGAYMDLLVLQFNKGAFTIEQAKKVLNGSFERLWPVLVEKFVEQKGRFLNQRLETEKEKRKLNAQKNKERIKNYWEKKKNTIGNSNEYSNVHTNDNTKSIPIENENENENNIEDKEGLEGKGEMIVPQMMTEWKKENPKYKIIVDKDFSALLDIAQFISGKKGVEHLNVPNFLLTWGKWCKYIRGSTLKNKSLDSISKFHLQEIDQHVNDNSTHGPHKQSSSKSTGANQLTGLLRTDIQAFSGTKQGDRA